MKVNTIIIFGIILILAPNSLATRSFGHKEYGIALLPEARCDEQANFLNRVIASNIKGAPNPVNNWHITLYQGAYDYEDITEIIKNLKKLEFYPIDLKFTNIEPTSNRWVDYIIEKDPSLQELHEKIVDIASKYHKAPLVRADEAYSSLPADKRSQIDKYGSSGILEHYKPHMTIYYKYPADPNIVEIVKTIQPLVKQLQCKAQQIAIGELGYNGNMIRVVYTKSLPH